MNLFIYDNPAAWAAGIAELWSERLRSNPGLRQCLPTGKTPNSVYAEMAKRVKSGKTSFAESTGFLLDEFGGLSPEDPGSCNRMIRDELINHVDLPESSFHLLNAQSHDLEQTCREYDQKIGAPLDLVILGIGQNGHLGMNEPGSDIDSLTRKVELHPQTIQASARYLTHNNLPTWGVTLGLRQIFQAREVWLWANGASKAEILKQAISGPLTTDVPASLLQKHAHCTFFVDRVAASALVKFA